MDKLANRLREDAANIDAEISNYYSLAYEPPRTGSGVEHRIEVRVRGDHKVRHRRGYRVKSRDEVMGERLQGAQFLGLVSNPLDIRLAGNDCGRIGTTAGIAALRALCLR